MTDLADSSLWALTWSRSVATLDGFGHISITSDLTVARREGFIRYQLNEGPLLTGDGEYRLIIRGGRLGVSFSPFPQGIVASASAKPYAKFQFETPRLIYIQNPATQEFAWTPEFKQ